MSAVAMNYPKYDSYKDSGVDWLGEIPSDWDLMRFKYIFREINDRSETGNEELLSVSQYTGVTKRADNVSTEILTNAESLEGYKKVKQNQLVSNIMLAWNGSLAFSNFDGIVSPAYSVYELNNNFDSRFFNYLVRSETYKAEYKRKSTGVVESRLRLYTEKFYNIWCSFPQKEIQTEVANFLDEKTAQIEQAIALKQQQIDKLNEYKQIVIQNAVTKGLNPKAPMKNSGVEWIGDIPEHWEVKKLKFIFDKIQTGTTPISQINGYFDGEINWFTPKDLNNDYLLDSERKLTQLAIVHKQVKLFEKNSVLVVGIGATSGKTSFMPIEGAFNQQITAFKSYYDNNKFYYYLIQSLSSIMLSLANYTTLPILNNEFFKKLILVQPPLAEQDRIVEYLDEKMQKFNNAKIAYQIQIDRLKEYKNILINQAVTGKIKIDS